MVFLISVCVAALLLNLLLQLAGIAAGVRVGFRGFDAERASVAVMMFGVSTATLFAAVSRLFRTRFGKGEQP